MAFSIGRLFLKPAPTRVATIPSAPVAAPAPTPTAEDRLTLSTATRQVTVGPAAALSITAEPGDTYWALARRYAATRNASGVPSNGEISRYVMDLQKANGPRLLAGQTVKLPLTARATYTLGALIAAQKTIAARRDAGEALPELDWRRAQAQWGYAETMDVTVPAVNGDRVEALGVREVAPSKNGGSIYEVTATEPPAVIAPVRQTTVMHDATLAVTAQPGETLFGIARRFAAAAQAPAAPSGAEINAYMYDLQKLNPGPLRAGQTVKLPLTPNAGPLLAAVIAAQQDWKRRSELGYDTSNLDWGRATAHWDFAESVLVEVPGMPGAWPEKLSVREYGLSRGATDFQVAFQDEFYRRHAR